MRIKKRSFYVTCSRATQQLALFVTGSEEEIKAMADAINDKGHFAAKGRVAIDMFVLDVS